MQAYKKKEIKGKTYYVHRLVWIEANGPIPKGMQVHHINSNKHDNRLENLRLVTPKENSNASDLWGKGYSITQYPKARPYMARRKIKEVMKYLGNYGTACGAYMANRMAYITTGT